MERKQRFETLLMKLNSYNSGEIGITRVAYTNEEQACIHAFIRMCKSENLSVRIDACGNVIGRREGKIKGLPPVVIGSHLDTVYQGGKYDGTIGVAAALEIIKRLNENGTETLHPIEIISFACEESSRFGVSTFGSKAMAGLISKENYRNLKDRDGITLEKALSLVALDFDSIDEASRENEKFKAFYELHIEQGPVLEKENKKIGIVTGIAAPLRFHVKIKGRASHSGTTPMNMRMDALLGAAEISLALENAAINEQDEGTVATVGVLTIPNGAMNVVPGEVDMKVDIRSTSIESRARVIYQMYEEVNNVSSGRNLDITIEQLSIENPVLLSQNIASILIEICEKNDYPYRLMQSGAGHDTMNMTRLCPAGLIFVPSVEGLSHHPDEHSNLDDILLGIDVLEAAVLFSAVINSANEMKMQ